ncbi:Ubiquitin-specific peptidase-like protein 1 [Tupaia chinensis]|uniref:Ubiquitin-specific peptidase-like protein 1 n=1 Tax=Tupaia chinensis TaxID=246437 RepID=L9JDE0_TUPCH|nr:Ubiquitin-specific peptidase-like protein 1 [Tupaia chinensis]
MSSLGLMLVCFIHSSGYVANSLQLYERTGYINIWASIPARRHPARVATPASAGKGEGDASQSHSTVESLRSGTRHNGPRPCLNPPPPPGRRPPLRHSSAFQQFPETSPPRTRGGLCSHRPRPYSSPQLNPPLRAAAAKSAAAVAGRAATPLRSPAGSAPARVLRHAHVLSGPARSRKGDAFPRTQTGSCSPSGDAGGGGAVRGERGLNVATKWCGAPFGTGVRIDPSFDSAKVTADGYCPACREKGKLKALKTYRISFEESIFLCEDLQCIFPLGFKSLNNLISPDSEDCHSPSKPQKRKILETSCEDLLLLANSKKTRNHTVTDGEQILDSKQKGKVYDENSSNLPDSNSQQNPVRTDDSSEQDGILETDVDLPTEKDPATVDVSGTWGTSSQNEGCTSELEMPLVSKRKSFPQTLHVQWKNAHALCWLDCILSALVHSERLKSTVTELSLKEESVFWQLFTKYNQASKLLNTNQLDEVTDDDDKKCSSEVFAEIETCLNEVRDEFFIRIQPQLRCTLGDMESPVFAFPLLLKIEPHIEKLFTYSFSWDFDCSQCGHQYQNRCMKSLVSFTHVIPEWHPLNAAHFGPCNNCSSKSQIRKMVLEKVSPIFMVHFVEGLPQSDLQHYKFHFEGCLYQITSVIQYQANNHFITWILDADGSWLECDDLKGQCSERHEKFEVPASEIHIVIWERKTSQVTDEGASYLPLKTDVHSFSDETPVCPVSWCVGDATSAEMSSIAHPENVSVTPHTLPQDETVAPKNHLLPDPEVNNNLPLTLEETTQKTASNFQVNSETLLLENKPVTENTQIGQTNAFQTQESLMASSESVLCNEKLIQDQFVELSFPSQVIKTNTQSLQLNANDNVITNSVDHIHAPGFIQGVQSELEDTQSKQVLTPKSEKLKPEHVIVQVSNLKKKETVAHSQTITVKSLQDQTPKESQKKPFVGSWVKGLLSRGASFMPPCVSAHNRSSITDLQPSVKGANNFGGFKTKGINQKANRVSRKAHRKASKPPVANETPPTPLPSGSTAAQLPAGMTAASEVLKKCESTIQGVQSELEDTQSKQVLTPKSEKLKPEHVIVQVSNLKKKETVAHSQTITVKSLQDQTPKESQKKPFVGSWVKGLLSRGASFMPPCVSAHNRSSITDLQPSVKGANNFGGFKTKGINQKANRVSRKAHRKASKRPVANETPPTPLPSGSTAAQLPADVTAASEVLKSVKAPQMDLTSTTLLMEMKMMFLQQTTEIQLKVRFINFV